MLISQYIDVFTESNRVRLDKVVIAYNKSLNFAKKIKGNINDEIDKLPKETASYLSKFLGIGGTMDLLV
jgi:hypothetical protein